MFITYLNLIFALQLFICIYLRRPSVYTKILILFQPSSSVFSMTSSCDEYDECRWWLSVKIFYISENEKKNTNIRRGTNYCLLQYLYSAASFFNIRFMLQIIPNIQLRALVTQYNKSLMAMIPKGRTFVICAHFLWKRHSRLHHLIFCLQIQLFHVCDEKRVHAQQTNMSVRIFQMYSSSHNVSLLDCNNVLSWKSYSI